MGWQLGWCHPYGGADQKGCGAALVPAGHQLHRARRDELNLSCTNSMCLFSLGDIS